MYSFNPYLTSSMIGSPIPFSLPGSTAGIATAAKKFSWSGIFNSIGKTVGTVNQIIPLYQNVKPIITNSKTLLKVMKGLNSPVSKQVKEPVNASFKPKEEKIIDTHFVEEEKVEIVSQRNPAKPFFN